MTHLGAGGDLVWFCLSYVKNLLNFDSLAGISFIPWIIRPALVIPGFFNGRLIIAGAVSAVVCTLTNAVQSNHIKLGKSKIRIPCSLPALGQELSPGIDEPI